MVHVAPPYPGNHDFNKIESTLPKNASKQSLAFLLKQYWEVFWKNTNKFLIIFVSLKQEVTLDFKKFEFHLLNTALCQVWFIFEIGPLVWEKMLKILKVNKRTVRLTDGHKDVDQKVIKIVYMLIVFSQWKS